MSKDLELRLRLTATDRNVAGTVRNTKKEVQGLAGTLGTVSRASRSTAQGMAGVTTAGEEANRMFRLQKGALQQAGYQFQDFFVQVGSGTSAFVALGQQGSQLLGLLGPGGALLGAVLAIGSVIGGSFVAALGEGEDATKALDAALKSLDDTIEESDGIPSLTREIRELAKESEVAARARIISAMAAAEEAARQSARAIRDSFDDIADTVGFSSLSDFFEGAPYGRVTAGAIEDLRDSLKLTGEDGERAARRIFLALRSLDANPAIENFRALEQTVAEVSTGVGRDSEPLQNLVGRLGEFFDAARTAEDRAEFLRSVIDDLGGNVAPEAAAEIAQLVEKLRMQADTLGMTTLEMIQYNRQADLKVAADKGATDEQIRAIDAAYDAIYAHERNTIAAKKEAEAKEELERVQRRYRLESQRLINELDPLGAQFEAVYEKQQRLIQLAAEGRISEAYRDVLIANLVEGMADAGAGAAEEFVNPFETAAGRVSQAVQNAIVSGEWDTIGEAIGNTLASSISSIIDDSITRSLARGVTANSGLSQQLSAAFAGPIIGAVAGGAIVLALREIDDYVSDNWDPTAARQAAQGTGTVLGDISAKSESIRRAVEGSESGIGQLVGINQGMLNALKNLQSGISGATTRIARGSGDISISAPGVMSARDLFSGATGGVLPVFDETLSAAFDFFDEMGEILTFGLLDLGSLLGGKTKKRDEGIQIIGGYISDLIDETVVNAYATFRVKKHAFDDYDTKERFQRIGGDVERQFSAVFASLFDTVLEAGVAIGYDEQAVADALNQGRIGTARISLEGLSAEQQQAELEAYFSSLFDDMAGGLFPFIEEFQVAGEGLGETLVRVANYVQITEEAVNRLGLQFSNLTGRDLVEASERLMEAAGGIEQFITSMQGFIDRFASDARQFELAQSDLTRALERAGLQLPATRQGYYDLLQAQDAATASGAENVALLLRLQDVADTYYTRLEDYQAELIRKQADLIRQQRATVADSLREAEQVADAIRSALTGLSHSIDRPAAIARDEAERYLRSIVRRGVVTDRDDFDAAVSSLVDIRAADFASFSDYLRAVSKAGTLLGELDDVAQSRVSVEQSMLSQLEKQVELIERGNSEQLAALRALQSTVESSAVSFNQVNRVTQVDNGSVNYGGGMTREVAEAVNRLRTELVDVQRSIERYSQRTSRILERIEQDGVEIRA